VPSDTKRELRKGDNKGGAQAAQEGYKRLKKEKQNNREVQAKARECEGIVAPMWSKVEGRPDSNNGTPGRRVSEKGGLWT